MRCEGRASPRAGRKRQSPELQCLEVTLNLLLFCALHPEDATADIGEDKDGQKDRVPQGTGQAAESTNLETHSTSQLAILIINFLISQYNFSLDFCFLQPKAP